MTMQLALIGHGHFGSNTARQIAANPGLKLHTVCDALPANLERARQAYGDATRYTADLNEVLNDPTIEGVCIATHTSAHHPVAKAALLAGKHVYVEKPFTQTVAEAEELIAIAKERGLTIHVDHVMVFAAAVQRLHVWVQSGVLGDVIYIDAQRFNLGLIKKDMSALSDLAVHDLAIIDLLSGGQTPQSVQAHGTFRYNPRASHTQLSVRYPTFDAHIQSSWLSPLKTRQIIVAGTQKMAVFDDGKPSGEKLILIDKGFDELAGSDVNAADYAIRMRNGDAVLADVKDHDALYASVAHFADCARTGQPSHSGPDQAIRVMKVVEAAEAQLAAQGAADAAARAMQAPVR